MLNCIKITLITHIERTTLIQCRLLLSRSFFIFTRGFKLGKLSIFSRFKSSFLCFAGIFQDKVHQKLPEEMTSTSKNRKHDYTITPTITRKVAQLHERYHDYTMTLTITRKVAQLHDVYIFCECTHFSRFFCFKMV